MLRSIFITKLKIMASYLALPNTHPNNYIVTLDFSEIPIHNINIKINLIFIL